MIASSCYCIVASTVTIVLVWKFLVSLQKGMDYVKRLHSIPCHACEYFTNDYRLKCTVCPFKACTEEAIACPDFEPRTHHYTYNSTPKSCGKCRH
jgi:hypothetical protein